MQVYNSEKDPWEFSPMEIGVITIPIYTLIPTPFLSHSQVKVLLPLPFPWDRILVLIETPISMIISNANLMQRLLLFRKSSVYKLVFQKQ